MEATKICFSYFERIFATDTIELILCLRVGLIPGRVVNLVSPSPNTQKTMVRKRVIARTRALHSTFWSRIINKENRVISF